jgi:uncharacterized membrane protein
MSEQTTPPTRGWVKALLALSLALNLLVIGAVGTAIYSFKSGKGPFEARSANFNHYARALSHQDRKEIGREIRREMKSLRRQTPKTRETYQALRAALMADIYDSQAVHALIKGQHKSGLKRQEIAQRLFLEHLDGMTADQRREFAERLGRGAKHGK